MIGKFLSQPLLNYLQRRIAANRYAMIRYDMEHTAFLMSEFILREDKENAMIMALRFQRLSKDATKLLEASKRS